jgi:hypothetical protein
MADAAEFARLLEIAHREASVMSRKVVEDHALGTLTGWSLNEPRGRLMFADHAGRGAVMAAQVVALYEPKSQTFQWAWDDATFPPDLVRAVKFARAWGHANSIAMLTTPLQVLDDEVATQLTAFTARLIDWPGIYRGVGGVKEIFLAFAPSRNPAGGDDRIEPAAAFALPG